MSEQLVTEFKHYVRRSSINYSYKLVLLRSVLQLCDAGGVADIEGVTEAFQEFYMSRLKSSLMVDREGAAINNISNMSTREVRTLVLDNPFAAYSRAGWMQRQGDKIGFSPELWGQLTLADKEELWQIADQRLEEYYQNRVETDLLRPLITEVQSSYLDARNQRFSGSVRIAKVITQDMPAVITASGLAPEEQYKVVGSAGQGNWASVPWVAVLDRSVTESIQSGVYVVYLFSSDMSSVYLALMMGVTEFLRQHTGRAGLELLRQKAKAIREQLDLSAFQWRDPSIGEERLAKQYEAGLIAYLRYDRDHIPDDDVLLADLERMLLLYRQVSEPAHPPARLLKPKDAIDHIHRFITDRGFQYSYSDLANFYLSLRTKPFVILAGISGTGKSLLPKLFAQAVSGKWRPIPVRPDWNDGSDLLGYLDLEGRFRPGELTSIVEECWANPEVPHIVVLDEMNLARVEHYMSDLLSVMETRMLEDDYITTASLFKDNHFRLAEDRERYSGVTLPDNLYLVGTVNMDETTHPFSKKVLDRANTIEFSRVDLKGYKVPADSTVGPSALSNDQMRGKLVHLVDALVEDSAFVDNVVDRLAVINDTLNQANLHVGYRVRDEIAIYMLHNKQLELLPETQAFDFQMLQKILPRIQGSSQPVRRVLIGLLNCCGGIDLSAVNDDLLSRLQEAAGGELGPYPRSAAKLITMLRRYEEDGFTSYWI